MNLTEKFEQLIVRTLAELRLSGDILVTVAVHEDPAVLCSIVSTANGKKHVHIDFHVQADEDSVLREIKQQLTCFDNTAPAETEPTEKNDALQEVQGTRRTTEP